MELELGALCHLVLIIEIIMSCHKNENWERSVFIPIPKKGNAKECSNYCTIALNSHASKEKAMAPHSSTLAGKSHGWKSLVGCSPWGREESNTTEAT